MIGVILCGGQSSRMGQDKGTMQLNEQNWAEIVAQNFIQLNISFVVSVNKSQKEIYKQLFSQQQLIIDDTTLNIKGPLLALITIYHKLPTEDLFVVACDMIDMKLPPLQYLIDKYKSKEKFDVYLFEPYNELQPVCAIYTTKFLNAISNNIKNNELKRFSLKELLKDFNNFVAIPPLQWLNYFNNYNSKEDLSIHNK